MREATCKAPWSCSITRHLLPKSSASAAFSCPRKGETTTGIGASCFVFECSPASVPPRARLVELVRTNYSSLAARPLQFSSELVFSIQSSCLASNNINKHACATATLKNTAPCAVY